MSVAVINFMYRLLQSLKVSVNGKSVHLLRISPVSIPDQHAVHEIRPLAHVQRARNRDDGDHLKVERRGGEVAEEPDGVAEGHGIVNFAKAALSRAFSLTRNTSSAALVSFCRATITEFVAFAISSSNFLSIAC